MHKSKIVMLEIKRMLESIDSDYYLLVACSLNPETRFLWNCVFFVLRASNSLIDILVPVPGSSCRQSHFLIPNFWKDWLAVSSGFLIPNVEIFSKYSFVSVSSMTSMPLRSSPGHASGLARLHQGFPQIGSRELSAWKSFVNRQFFQNHRSQHFAPVRILRGMFQHNIFNMLRKTAQQHIFWTTVQQNGIIRLFVCFDKGIS